jgi:hypothetical protein
LVHFPGFGIMLSRTIWQPWQHDFGDNEDGWTRLGRLPLVDPNFGAVNGFRKIWAYDLKTIITLIALDGGLRGQTLCMKKGWKRFSEPCM